MTKSSEKFRNRDALGLFGVHIEEVKEEIRVTDVTGIGAIKR